MIQDAENPALAANMRQLMDGRSIQTLREQMAKDGLAIGTQTLHRAVLGKSGNRLESLQKIAKFFHLSVDQLLQPNLGADADAWPFSAELYGEVSTLSEDEVQSLESAMWTHLRKPLPDVLQRQRIEAARRAVDALSAPTSVTERTQRKRSA